MTRARRELTAARPVGSLQSVRTRNEFARREEARAAKEVEGVSEAFRSAGTRAMGGGAGRGEKGDGPGSPRPPTLRNPSHVKYKAYASGDGPGSGSRTQTLTRKTATQHLKDLRDPPDNLEQPRQRPEIVEFLNMCDYTHQVVSKVDVDEPLFQSFPPSIEYHKYEPFRTYEALLWFRNNDYVPRRIKIEDPKNRHFTVRRMRGAKGERLVEEKGGPGGRPGDGVGKIAPGMEVAFKVVFAPSDKGDYAVDLVVATEREKFIVPVRCVGNKPALDFPDFVRFDPTPVKQWGHVVKTVRNVGAKTARFRLFAPEPFTVSPAEGILDVGECAQVRLGFRPEACGIYEGELEVELGDGLAPISVGLKGEGCEILAGLAQGEVEMLPTFIHKSSQRTFRVVNHSDVPVKFEVKKLADSFLEEEARTRVVSQFGETLTRSLGGSHDDLRRAMIAGRRTRGEGEEGSELSSEDEDEILGAKAVEFATRTRGLDRALLADNLHFEHPDFTCAPLHGEVVPGGEFEVTVRFHPKSSGRRMATAYVDVEGREDRLPLSLKGHAVGPIAVFTYDALEVGDVFIGAVHQYEVELVNRGEVAAEFRLVPPEPGSRAAVDFSFEPSAGVIPVGEIQTVIVTLCSDTLGEFDESFEWEIMDGEIPTTLDFKGKVVGPAFTVDAQSLDFGVVGYGFRYTKDFTVHNGCEIPMRFSLRVPGDAKGEFTCLPSAGTILPFGKQKVELELISETETRYTTTLDVDVPGVGKSLHRIPLAAHSKVPTLELPAGTLDFGPCFIRHKYTRTITMKNGSRIPAKFVVEPQDAQSRGLCAWDCEPASGSVDAQGSLELTFTVVAERLGLINLPATITTVGSSKPPMQLLISAHSRGPTLGFSQKPDDPDSVWVPELKWGKVPVLRDESKVIYVTNKSLIPADIRAFVQDPDSAFFVDAREKTLEPGEEYALTVTVHMDQLMVHRDELNVMVIEGAPFMIPLTAEGIGSLTTCADLDGPNAINFGPQLKDRPFHREIVVTNNARKLQQLVWHNITAEEKIKEAIKKRAAEEDAQESYLQQIGVKKKEKKPLPTDGELGITFSVTPQQITVAPKSSVVFTLSGISEYEGDAIETLVCKNTAGSHREAKEVMTIHASASVAIPLMNFSKDTLAFEFSHDPDFENEVQEQQVTMRNVSEVTLRFTIQMNPPFDVEPKPDWELEPSEAATIRVSFDPDYRGDCQSHEVRDKLLVCYDDNPHVDSIDLGAELSFPNLDLSHSFIDFGSVLNDTTKREYVTVRNTGSVPARFEWVFETYDDADIDEDEPTVVEKMMHEGLNKAKRIKARRSKRDSNTPLKNADPEQVFDVLPIRGYLQPGEEERVEISYFAQAHSKVRAVAVCEVEGGPAYDVELAADAHLIKYELNTTSIDFGRQTFDKTINKEIVLTNTGRVKIPFRVNTKSLSRQALLSVTPKEGEVGGDDACHINFAIRPGIPDKIDECVTLEVAHFEPIRIPITGEGIYGCVAMSLPRAMSDEYAVYVEEARILLLSRGYPNPNLPPMCRDGVPEPDPMLETFVPEDTKGLTLGKVTGTIVGGTLKKTSAGTQLALSKRQPTPTGRSRFLSKAPFNSSRPRGLGEIWMKPKTYKEDDEEEPDLIPMMGTMATVEDEEIDDVSLLGTGKKRRKKKKYVPTRAEIWHEADRLWMMAELLEREREREERRAQRLALTGSELEPVPPPGSPPAATDGGLTPFYRHVPRQKPLTPEFYPEKPAFSQTGVLYPPLGTRTGPPIPGGRGARAVTPRATSRMTMSRATSRGASRGGGEPPRLVTVARYAVDFGNVVKGAALSKRFTVQNLGDGDMMFAFDKKDLEKRGFRVYPEYMPKLSGQPYCQTTEVTLTLNTAMEHVEEGAMEFTLPLNVTGGPQALVTIKAVVEVPGLSANVETLDFGNVQVGHCKWAYVQLHNDRSVACDWSVKKPPARIKRDGEPEKPPDVFVFTPSRGTLKPGERKNVKVRYMPNGEIPKGGFRKQTCIVIEHNPVMTVITTVGQAHELLVRCDPGPSLDCGSVMPRGEDDGEEEPEPDAPAEESGEPEVDEDGNPVEKPKVFRKPKKFTEQAVWLVNDSEVDVCVYLQNFDTQHLVDEEIIRHAAGLKESPMLLLPPRVGALAAEEEWAKLVEADTARKAEEEAAAAAENAENAEPELDEDGNPIPKPEGEEGGEAAAEPEPEPEAAAEDENADEAEPKAAELDLYIPPDDSTCILVTGPAYSLASETALELAAKYRVPKLDINECVRAAAEAIGDLGLRVRTELGLPRILEDDSDDEDEEDADDAEAIDAPPAEEGDEKPEGETAAPEAEAPAAGEEGEAAAEPETPEELVHEDGKLTIKTLADVLERVIFADYVDGFVVDGVHCEFAASPLATVKALTRALGMEKSEPRPPAKPDDAGDDWEPPEPEEGAFVLHGRKKLMVVSLEVDDGVAAKRETLETRGDEPHAEPDAAAAADTPAEPAEAEKPPDGEEGEEGEEAPPEEKFELSEETAAAIAKHREFVQTLMPLFGASHVTYPDNCARVYAVVTDECENPGAVVDVATGGDENPNPMPTPPKPLDYIPPAEVFQVITRPKERVAKPPVTKFKVLTPSVQPKYPHARKPPTPEPAEGEEGAEGAEGAEAETPTEEEPQENEMQSVTRWNIRAGDAVQVIVRFESPEVGDFTEYLAFECVGGKKVETLECRGRCDYPTISDDFRNVYAAKKTKASQRPPDHLISHQFIIAKPVPELKVPGKFEFGPLLNNWPVPEPPPPWEEGMQDAKGDPIPDPGPVDPHGHHRRANIERLRITNNGLHDVKVKFRLKRPVDDDGNELEEPGDLPIPGVDVFKFEPEEMTLFAEETHELIVTAYPKGEHEWPPEPEPEPEGEAEAAPAESEEPPADGEAPAEGEPPADGEAAEGEPEPQDGDTEKATAKNVQVSAFPKGPCPFTIHDCVIVAEVEDNPGKFEFPMSCVGVTPTAVMSVDVDEETGISFDRVIAGAKEERKFRIKNTSLLPFRWKLELPAEDCPTQFKISELEGELWPSREHELSVTFTSEEATEAIEMNTKLVVFDMQGPKDKDLQPTPLFRDEEGNPKPITERELKISAEAFVIAVDIKYPGDPPEGEEKVSALDFGLIRANEEDDAQLKKSFTLHNTGKYPVTFSLSNKAKATKDLFAVEPAEGEIGPGAEVPIELHFNKAVEVEEGVPGKRKIKREVHLVNNGDLHLSVVDSTGVRHDKIPVKVSIRTSYAKYALTPSRGVNFGPTTYNTETEPRIFEISNVGDFPFDYNLFDYGSRGSADAELEKDEDGNPLPPPKTEGGELELGAFVLKPPAGTIEPGEKATIEVVFKAEDDRTFSELCGVDISGRDPSDKPLGVVYPIAGESVIPGIAADDFRGIFEEHKLVVSLDPSMLETNAFDTTSKVFSFGPVLANLSGDEEAEAEAEPVLDENGEPLPKLPTGGVKANFRISNPKKVPCSVDLTLAPKEEDGGGDGGKFPIEVHPASLDIPPHEHRYVTVYFDPRAISSYSATLDAVVRDGADPKTKQFTCEVRGDGTLPHVTVEEPADIAEEDGLPLVKFPKMLLGRKMTKPIVLRNNGILPAVLRAEMMTHKHFSIEGGGVTTTLEPGCSRTLRVTFDAGKTKGEHAHSVRLAVKQNAYETQTVKFVGVGYMDDVMFADLPRDLDDELRFDDGPVGEPKSVTFKLVNTSSFHYRFEWPEPLAEGEPAQTDFSFAPRVGHVHAGKTKAITCTFNCSTAVAHDAVELAATLARIEYREPKPTPAEGDDPLPEDYVPPLRAPEEWDSDVRVAKEVEVGGPEDPDVERDEEGNPVNPPPEPPEPVEGESPPPREMKTVMVPAPEVSHELVPAPEPVEGGDGSVEEVQSTAPLKVFAVADDARFSCETSNVAFKATMMLQRRAHVFPLKNDGTARLDFKFTIEPDAGPYVVEPAAGTVPAGEEAQIKVIFAPQEVVDCKRTLRCEFLGTKLDEGMEPLVIPLNGKVLRPWCHFELGESDYLSGGRRMPNLPGPSTGAIAAGTKTVECTSLGTHIRNTKRFLVLNPTSVAYAFRWAPVPAAGAAPPVPAFRCLTPEGVIAPGKRYDMVFEFVPEVEGTSEAFFDFKIDEQSISVPFLFAGTVVEPAVQFEVSSVNFGKVLTGTKIREIVALSNHENTPFAFNFDQSSWVLPDGSNPRALTFEPMSGTVPANGFLPIHVTFAPDTEKAVNYNVVANVKRKPTRLTLNVKGEGYGIHEVMEMEPVSTTDGTKAQTLVAAPGKNVCDLGQVLIREQVTRKISFRNEGEIKFDFAWDTGTNPRVKVSPEFGTLAKGEKANITLTYSPINPEQLRGYQVTCGIVNGRKYVFSLDADGHKPSLKFSHHSHDFGACLVHQPGLPPRRHTLTVTNMDTKEYSIDCIFDSTEFPFLHVGDSPASLAPGQSADVDVEFFPDQPKHYKALVPFSVNGLYTVNVVYTGEGVPMRLELVKPEQNSVHFGHVREGHSETREIRMVNKSRLPVTCVVDKQCLEDLAALGVTPADGWNGQTPVMFPPRQANGISFKYKPSRRGPSFDEELKLLINGATMPISLTRLRGGSIGTEVRLATDTMSFGTVTLGSRVSKKLAMQNTGDVGVKFAFDAKAAEPNFSIKPAEGFVPTNQDVQLEVWFHPTEEGADVRADKIKCQIGSKGAGSAEPLDLTLTGACVPQEAQEGKVEFKTTVRQTAEGAVSVTNGSNRTWNLRPAVTGDQWSGPEFFEVKPGATAEYTLTYRPLSMATEEEPHVGSVLFALPDGSCLLHALQGVAEEPDSMGSVEAEIPARKPGSVRVKVNNWLNRRQRFKVTVEIEGADPEKPDPTVTLKGPDYFDCPASAEREYKLGFFAHKEGTTKAKVTFTNEDTKEFAHYDVTVTATAADVQGTLRLHGACRQKATATVKVVNPLSEPVVFTSKCDHPCVVVPETLTVPANGSALCEVAYRPVVCEPETTLPFVLSSAELGDVTHTVSLSSAPAPPKRGVSFVVPLGQREVKSFKFMHYAEPESQTEYACEFQRAAAGAGEAPFACAATHVAHGAGDDGMEQSLEISFEPVAVGSHYRDVLVVKSDAGHEYVCPVTAKCVPPKPQGPFKLSGAGGSVNFKNVFDVETEFTMTTDNPWFTVDRVATVGAKAETQVAVKYGAPEGWDEGKDAPTTGKLLVTCKGSPAPWVYYLKATP